MDTCQDPCRLTSYSVSWCTACCTLGELGAYALWPSKVPASAWVGNLQGKQCPFPSVTYVEQSVETRGNKGNTEETRGKEDGQDAVSEVTYQGRSTLLFK